jgi:hypothetical protein
LKKSKIITITLMTTLIIGGIVYAGVDAYKHTSETSSAELWDDNEFYYSQDENGNVEVIPKSDTITVPTGYAVVEDGHIVEFIPVV